MGEHKIPGASKGPNYKKEQPPKKLRLLAVHLSGDNRGKNIQTETGACYTVDKTTGAWTRIKTKPF